MALDELAETRGKLRIALEEIGELHMLVKDLERLADARLRAMLHLSQKLEAAGLADDTVVVDPAGGKVAETPTPLPRNRAARRRAARAG